MRGVLIARRRDFRHRLRSFHRDNYFSLRLLSFFPLITFSRPTVSWREIKNSVTLVTNTKTWKGWREKKSSGESKMERTEAGSVLILSWESSEGIDIDSWLTSRILPWLLKKLIICREREKRITWSDIRFSPVDKITSSWGWLNIRNKRSKQ